MVDDILRKDGLSLKKLEILSYRSNLGINLKKNLHYFIKEELFKELKAVNQWYDLCTELESVAIDYRIKSIQSAKLKYARYYPLPFCCCCSICNSSCSLISCWIAA